MDAKLRKEMIPLKTESTNETYNYLAARYAKTQQVGSTSSKTEQSSDSESSAISGSWKTDSLEISSDAYAAYSEDSLRDDTYAAASSQSTSEILDILVSDGTPTSNQASEIADALAPPARYTSENSEISF